jgi:hypothetical protein
MQLILKNKTNLTFLIIILISIFFLFWKINLIPFGLNNDAAWEGSAAIEILKGNYSEYLPYAAQGWRGEGILRLIVAFYMLFLGFDPITIRLSSVFFGLGLVIASYFLIKELFNEKLALLSSFFIAISGWLITFSKTGWRAVTVPFFTTLLFYLYFKGLKNKKYLYFSLSGILLGIVSFYTYDAARAVPILFAVWIFIEIISDRTYFKKYYKNLFVLFISAFLVSLPMLFYATTNYDNFKSRSDFLFIGHQIEKEGNYSPVINNLKNSIFLFNVSGNGDDYFIKEPLIDPPVSFLLPFGIIFSLIILIIKRDKGILFMFLWLTISLIPGILSIPNGNRAIGAIPPVFFFCAAGLYYPVRFLYQKIKNKFLKIFIFFLILIFCAISVYVTFDNYLGKDRRELRGFYPETKIVTDYIKTIWNSYDIYLIDNYPRELLTFYLYKEGQNAFVWNYNWLENSTDLLNISANQNKGLAFFMFDNPSNELIANQLTAKYPNSKKFILWYENDNIRRPAALVILVP